MKYYKVKQSADQIRTNIRYKGGFLIKDELYTERVINSALKSGKATTSFIDANFTTEDINTTNTYWFFGAQFKCS